MACETALGHMNSYQLQLYFSKTILFKLKLYDQGEWGYSYLSTGPHSQDDRIIFSREIGAVVISNRR